MIGIDRDKRRLYRRVWDQVRNRAAINQQPNTSALNDCLNKPRRNRIRVLIVVTNADLAGAPSHVRDLVMNLRHQVEVAVAFGQSGPIKTALESEGIRTYLITGMQSQISVRTDLAVIQRLLNIVKESQPDFIHAHSAKAGMVARIVGLLHGTPVLYTVHGWGFGPGRRMTQSVIVWMVELLLAPFAARYIMVSRADEKAARRKLLIRKSRITVIHNGVPDAGLRADVEANSGIVMVARVDRSKDHEMALHAFSKVQTTMRLQLIGSGTDEPTFVTKAMVWAQSAKDRIDFVGESTTVRKHLAANAVFLLASKYEGLPLSIIEAMGAGLPVVATNVGGVNELIDQDCHGYLIPTGDIDKLSAALQRLVDQGSLRRRLGEAARERYEACFRLDTMCEQVLAVYTSMSTRSGMDSRHGGQTVND